MQLDQIGNILFWCMIEVINILINDIIYKLKTITKYLTRKYKTY